MTTCPSDVVAVAVVDATAPEKDEEVIIWRARYFVG